MSPATIGAIGIAALFLLLLLRIPIWVALFLVGMGGNLVMTGAQGTLALAGTVPFDVASSYTLSVLPLFILMGEVATRSQLSAALFTAAQKLLSNLRGGLSIATIAASACFGAVSGSSVATAATMTRIALPEMRKAGYDDGLATGSVAAGGSLGILIPPSIILVIYAAIAEQSIPRLFAAALFPGLLLTGLYIAVALAVASLGREYAPPGVRLPLRERLAALKEPWQFLVLFVVTIGGIYAGIFSPTEAAAIGAFGAIVLGFLARRLNIRQLLGAIQDTVITCGALFVIIFGANMFSFFIVQTQFPALLVDTARALELSGLSVIVLVAFAYIVLGCFLEGFGLVLITVPMFLPLITQFGYDPVWFGIIVVIVVEVGLMTPPVGINIFVIQAQARDINIVSIYRGIVPFLIAPIVLIAIMLLVPGVALWLPKMLYG